MFVNIEHRAEIVSRGNSNTHKMKSAEMQRDTIWPCFSSPARLSPHGASHPHCVRCR